MHVMQLDLSGLSRGQKIRLRVLELWLHVIHLYLSMYILPVIVFQKYIYWTELRAFNRASKLDISGLQITFLHLATLSFDLFNSNWWNAMQLDFSVASNLDISDSKLPFHSVLLYTSICFIIDVMTLDRSYTNQIHLLHTK